MKLKDKEIHIWHYNLNEEDYLLEKTNPILSSHEQQRCNSYLREDEKIRYTCIHRFVRLVLAGYLNIPAAEIEFAYSSMSKPFIKNSDLYISYSYRAHLGLLAISKGATVGVDIEKIRPLLNTAIFSDYTFSPKEKEIIYKNEQNLEDTLFTFWTYKEAFIKAFGVGLNTELTEIDLSSFYHNDENQLPMDKNNTYTIKKLKIQEGYKAAFAVKGKLNTFTEYNY